MAPHRVFAAEICKARSNLDVDLYTSHFLYQSQKLPTLYNWG